MASDARYKLRIAQIAAHNDQARRAMGFYCRVYETPAFQMMSVDDKQAVRRLVESYDAWDATTRFVGERDYGTLYKLTEGKWTTDAALAGGAIAITHWKIDYFDAKFQGISEAPWDIKRTGRLLTFSLAGDEAA